MHAHHDVHRPVRVQVITVSTTRSSHTDASGPLLRELLTTHGHVVAGHDLVADDPEAIGARLDALLLDVSVEAIVLTGGTGVSARDCTPSVVRARLDRELPGFGELFRWLSFAQVGAAAMLSTAVGGVARGRPVFALPGSTAACELGMLKLILPELSHLVREVSKETPLPARGKPAELARADAKGADAKGADAKGADAKGAGGAEAAPQGGSKEGAEAAPEPAPVPEGISISVAPDIHRPEEPEIASGWKAGLRAIGGTLDTRSYGDIPEALERVRPVVDVLESAHDRARVTLADGREYTAFGFPDLVRNSSRVLLVREAEPLAEIVALHRWPRQVGLCAEGEPTLIPSADADPGMVAEARTGRPSPGAGRLFAVEAHGVYLLDSRKVALWDGRKLGPAEPMASALGSLVLGWSQR